MVVFGQHHRYSQRRRFGLRNGPNRQKTDNTVIISLYSEPCSFCLRAVSSRCANSRRVRSVMIGDVSGVAMGVLRRILSDKEA